jgi:hypothetical protein
VKLGLLSTREIVCNDIKHSLKWRNNFHLGSDILHDLCTNSKNSILQQATLSSFIFSNQQPIYLSIYLWLHSPFVGPWPLFQFLDPYTAGRIPWTGDRPVARPLPTHRTIQTQNKRTETSMPWVGFETTIPAFERAKRVHASDSGATVISLIDNIVCINFTPFCIEVPLIQLLLHHRRRHHCQPCAVRLRPVLWFPRRFDSLHLIWSSRSVTEWRTITYLFVIHYKLTML